MTDTLGWTIRGEVFQDGSLLKNWVKIAESGVWHWQYDTHDLSFEIYEHDGQFWKLYRARFVTGDSGQYSYDFGGQACRMVLVRYLERARSPHSNTRKEQGDLEWVRTYEFDARIHDVVKAGEESAKYGKPFGRKFTAA